MPLGQDAGRIRAPAWAATIAVEAEDILTAIREAQSKGGRPKNSPEPKPSQIIDEVSKPNERRTEAKAAALFNTNRTYVNQAARFSTESAPRLMMAA